MSVKLIVALDFDNLSAALTLVDQLDYRQCALKVGSEMFTLFGPNFVRTLIAKQFKVFLDLKFHDIPNTVAKSCVAGAELGVWMMTVHASGGSEMLVTAKDALDNYGSTRPLLIAVTVLTSINETGLSNIGISMPLCEHVVCLAQRAQQAGLDGVVSSALEVPMIKAACGKNFLAITPGIRLGANSPNDQARISTPSEALKAGANYLVIGRPVTRAKHPAKVVSEILNYA